MCNHVKGNWFVSIFKMRTMAKVDLENIANSENYRTSTRRNARLELDNRRNTI